MSSPMTDLNIRYVLQAGFKMIRSNPERYMKEIFADTQNPAISAIYGKTAQQAADWIKKNDIPINLGFDLSEVQLPAITINLSSSTADQAFIGDEGLGSEEDLGYQEKEVLVPAFQPAGMVPVNDENGEIQSYILTPPEDMPFEQKELFLPGLKLRDGTGREYFISLDIDGNIIISKGEESQDLREIDLTKLEVVSPVIQARYSRGHMQYMENITIAVHGMSNRQEGLWIYYMTMYILLKFRPILTGTFGLDLSTPSASDYSKAEQFMGENVWVRFITVTARTSWTWENTRKADILGLILSVTEGRKGE